MIYTLKRDDMPSLSQWIKKEVTFDRQKLLLFLVGVTRLELMTSCPPDKRATNCAIPRYMVRTTGLEPA